MTLSIKPGVKLRVMQPQLALAALVVGAVFNDFGYSCQITGGDEDGHLEMGYHPIGFALDFGTHHIPRAGLGLILQRVRSQLGFPFDCILEDLNEPNEHLHVEYDLKKARQ